MILLDDAQSARAFPQAPFTLVQCVDCGFLFNRDFDAAQMRYADAFEESQHFSPTFGRFVEEQIEALAAMLGPEQHVVEVGCGRGEYLAALCARTGCRATGIDPGWRPGRLPAPLPPGLAFLAEPLAERHRTLEADLLLCRHTLEHVSEVRDFLDLAIATGAARPGFGLLFETPDAERIVTEGAFWDLYHEHCSYFTAETKRRLFQQAGLAVTRLERVFGGQYLLLEARRGGLDASGAPPPAPAGLFARRLAASMARWRDRIGRWSDAGERLVLWGGGSKAVAFLTALGAGAPLLAAVDINPYRQGRYLPGSGLPIVAPEAMRELRPDRVVVMNPLYQDEIAARLRDMGVSPALVALG